MITFSDNKAGMSGLDKEKITKVIEENTSSNYSSFTKKQQKRIEDRINEIKYRIKTASEMEKLIAAEHMDHLEKLLESERDLGRDCVCIDMDAYYASVEMRDDPSLRDIPMAVGSQSMLSTSNYLARRYGVRAAMPGFIAKKLCPNLRIVPGNHKKYSRISRQFSKIFEEYDPELSMMSLDEAYIDLTDYVKYRISPKKWRRIRYGGHCNCRSPIMRKEENDENCEKIEESCLRCRKISCIFIDYVEFGIDREEIVNEIRFRVEQETGLTCSAGIAANFMLAKICSDFNKPNGQYCLRNNRQEILNFLQDLPIRKVSGIGRVSEAHLQACSINTVGDILKQKAVLPLVFSNLSQECFLRKALGIQGRPSDGTDFRRKSVSVERTFSPTSNFVILQNEHEENCKSLEQDIQKLGIIGAKTVTLKLKLSSFDVLTRSHTLTDGIFKTFNDIYKHSFELLLKEKGKEIRLLGVRLSQLIFDEKTEDGSKSVKPITEFWKNAKRKKLEDEEDKEDDSIIPIEIDWTPCPICSKLLENDRLNLEKHIDACLKENCTKEDLPDLICLPMDNKVKKKAIKDKVTNMKNNQKRKQRNIGTIDNFFVKK